MMYFTITEFFIPTLKPMNVVDTKAVVSLLNKNIQLQTKKAELLKKQKLEEEQKEKENKLNEEKEKVEKEKLEKEKLQKEKTEREKKEKAEKEKLDKVKKEKERLEKEKLQKEKTEKDKIQRKIDEEMVYTDAIYNNDALNNPYPKYPIISKKEGEEGEVVLLVKISPEGEVIDIKIHKSSGYERLDNASIYAVRGWHFIPAKNRFGMPIESSIKIPFVFKIRNAI